MKLANVTEEYQDNMGGTDEILYVIPADDIETWPTLPSPNDETVEMEDACKYTGNFVLKAGKSWKQFRSTQDMAEIKWEDQGEIDGLSQKHLLEVYHPQLRAKIMGFVRKTNNKGLVWIGTTREGTKAVVGTQQIPARRVPQSGTTGKVAADRKGTTLSWFSYGHGPAYIYGGTVSPIDDGSSGSGS